jgi:phosphate-selective porin OprO/OprP
MTHSTSSENAGSSSMSTQRIRLGRTAIAALALLIAASAIATAQQSAPQAVAQPARPATDAAVRLPQPGTPERPVTSAPTAGSVAGTTPATASALPAAPPTSTTPPAVVRGYEQFAARPVAAAAPAYRLPAPAAPPTGPKPPETVATPPGAPAAAPATTPVVPEPDSQPDFSLVSNRQQPIPDPEQPGNLTKYLEDVDRRIKGLEGAAKAPPRYPQIRMSGFMQLDDALFSQSADSKAVLGNIQNGAGFRRTRLQAVGKLTDFTAFSIEMDFATAGRPSFMDVWGEQSNLPFFGTLRIGQFRQPITMDGWTSIRHLDFMERNAVFQGMDPFRRVGIMAYDLSEDERTEWAYSVYGTALSFWNGASTTVANEGADNRFGTQLTDHGGVSTAIRASHLLFYDEPSEGRYLLHVGGGYNFSQLGGNPNSVGTDANAYDARPIPEVFVGDFGGFPLTAAGTPAVLDTGRIRARNYNLWHTEVAMNYGSFHFQNEWMLTTLNQTGGPTVWMPGTYAQCGYFLTGESSAYNKQAGVMDYNVVPYSDFFGLGRGKGFGGWGAWEVVGRWSYYDLTCNNANLITTTPATFPPSPNRGVLNESTVGLNWWWNRYTRVQFNWIHGMPNYQAVPTGFPGPVGGSPFDVFASRFQIEF